MASSIMPRAAPSAAATRLHNLLHHRVLSKLRGDGVPGRLHRQQRRASGAAQRARGHQAGGQAGCSTCLVDRHSFRNVGRGALGVPAARLARMHPSASAAGAGAVRRRLEAAPCECRNGGQASPLAAPFLRLVRNLRAALGQLRRQVRQGGDGRAAGRWRRRRNKLCCRAGQDEGYLGAVPKVSARLDDGGGVGPPG